MDRRDFLKLTAITGTTAALGGCEGAPNHLIRFIPEEELASEVAVWKPSVCTLCPAGCGLKARVMRGEAEIVRNGHPGVLEMGLAKKLEGNEDHPVNHGKLCPRGQAGVQLTYHPDRIRQALRSTGPRGTARFEEIAWDEALNLAVAKLAEARKASGKMNAMFLTRPLSGQREVLIERFMAALGGPPPVEFQCFDEPLLRQANLISFGHFALPSFDFAHSNYVLGFGADFLGTWNSPVAQAVAFGKMRQGRPGVRGKFVQVEQRVSQTGANADEWIYARPGSEGLLALALAHVIIRDKLRPSRRAGPAGDAIDGWHAGLPGYSPERVAVLAGMSAVTIEGVAHEIATHGPAVAVIGGPALAHTNGLENALAVNALNALLGALEKPGGIFFAPQVPAAEKFRDMGARKASASSMRHLVGIVQAEPPDVLLLYDANPVFGTPSAWNVPQALDRIPFIISFGSFLDETSVLADLILPDHAPLESWLDHEPESGPAEAVASVAAPAVKPLHPTRAMPDTLLELAQRFGEAGRPLLPWPNFEAMLRERYAALRSIPSTIEDTADENEFWDAVQERGGWWAKLSVSRASPQHSFRSISPRPLQVPPPRFQGSEQEYPFHFLPFVSQAFLDGSLAHLPWLQEMPDVLSTVMWGTWVEINPKIAERLNIKTGDVVELSSPQATLRAPTVITPGIAPEVIAMPVGQGHTASGRYASGRGANPLSILADIKSAADESHLAWAATRVKVTRVGEGKLALFAGGLTRFPHEVEPR